MLEYCGVKCTGKKIHNILLESSQWDEQAVSRGFIQECKILSDLSHPHILQFLGLYFLAGSKLPLLVMEYLPHNLDDCLSTDIGIPLPVKMSILCDTARGLTHLHQRSPPIIHRDLTAKNVLVSSNICRPKQLILELLASLIFNQAFLDYDCWPRSNSLHAT